MTYFRTFLMLVIAIGLSLSYWSFGQAQTIADYDKALRLNPKDATTYCSRGAAYAAKGDYDRAISDFTAAIRLNPKYAEAFSSRGFAYSEKNDLDRAISDFSQALRLNPNLVEAYHRGVVYAKKGDYDQAISDFNQAIRLNPNLAEAHSNLGLAYYIKGNIAQARASLQRAKELGDPDAQRVLDKLPKR